VAVVVVVVVVVLVMLLPYTPLSYLNQYIDNPDEEYSFSPLRCAVRAPLVAARGMGEAMCELCFHCVALSAVSIYL
jgi:hypothetical protein